MNTEIISYYRDRANEYEKVYSKPERQSELLQAGKMLQDIFKEKEVIEIACGTGYWTEKIGVTARNIFATDINDAVLEIAKTKTYPLGNVTFQTANFHRLPNLKKYESLFGGFIWSHIHLEVLSKFIYTANNLVVPNGTIVFMDNTYIKGSNLPVTEEDDAGNSYQIRTLENGTTHKVLKNFPTETFIRELLKGKAAEIEFIQLKYYWILKYKCS